MQQSLRGGGHDLGDVPGDRYYECGRDSRGGLEQRDPDGDCLRHAHQDGRPRIGVWWCLRGGNRASALAVTGTPSVGDQLVFHFLMTQSSTGSGSSTAGDAAGSWQLVLVSGSSQAEASQNGYANGTRGALDLHSATQTATGFDLTLPFSVGSTFSYIFAAAASGSADSQALADGATLWGSMSAYLQGIDAETASGMFINSASFDQSTGLGTISATPTTSTREPSSLALLGTGFMGLIPLIRRRKS